MRLLLTSAGITNNSIKQALTDLVDKDLNQCYISFVPTAANIEDDIEWMKEDIENLRLAAGIKDIVMTDIEKLPNQN